jgi:hypothetical protein
MMSQQQQQQQLAPNLSRVGRPLEAQVGSVRDL